MDKIKSFIGKIKHIFKKKPRLMVGLVIALALSLPFIINQVLKQQDLRQRASSAPPVSFAFVPSSNVNPIPVGTTFDVSFDVNTATGEDIGAVHFIMGYDKSIISQPTVVSQDSGLQIIKTTNTSDSTKGYVDLTLVNPSISQVTGNAKILTFRFTTLAAGTANLYVIPSQVQVTASLSDTFVQVSNTSNITGTYTIGGATIFPSPTPTTGAPLPPPTTISPSPSPTLDSCELLDKDRPLLCGCDTNYQCASGYCNLGGTAPINGINSGVCTASPSTTVSPTLTRTPTASVIPTSTLAPTATIAPGETTLRLIVQLPGIGTGAANLGLNPHPIRPQRTGSIQVLDGTTILVKSASALMTYETQCGCYTGTFALGPTFASGSYTAKVKFDNSLYKAFPGIIQIASGQNANSAVPTVTLVTGDITGPQNLPDNTLDILDYNLLQACYRGQPACTTSVAKLADFNDDGVVRGDDIDANIQARGFYIRNGD